MKALLCILACQGFETTLAEGSKATIQLTLLLCICNRSERNQMASLLLSKAVMLEKLLQSAPLCNVSLPLQTFPSHLHFV